MTVIRLAVAALVMGLVIAVFTWLAVPNVQVAALPLFCEPDARIVRVTTRTTAFDANGTPVSTSSDLGGMWCIGGPRERSRPNQALVVLVLGAEAGVVLLGGMLLRRRLRPSPTPGAPLPYGSSS